MCEKSSTFVANIGDGTTKYYCVLPLKMLKQLKYLTRKDWFFALIIAAFVICDVYCELKIPEFMQQIVVTIKSSGTINDILANGLKMLMFAVFAILSVIVAKFFSSTS